MSRNVDKYEFLTGEDVLSEKELLKGAATIKRFEYSLLGKELKKANLYCKKTISNIRYGLWIW